MQLLIDLTEARLIFFNNFFYLLSMSAINGIKAHYQDKLANKKNRVQMSFPWKKNYMFTPWGIQKYVRILWAPRAA